MSAALPTLSLGCFGKIPSFGDFVARGTGSPCGRAFERWLQLANDRLAEASCTAPTGPVGFVFRDDAASSLLVGTLSGSVDKVGRRFPLALFCELGRCDGLWAPALPVALAPVLEQLGGIAHRARRDTQAELVAKLDAVALPAPAALVQACASERARLHAAPAAAVLEGLFGDVDARCYAIDLLLRACESARRSRAVTAPLVLDRAVSSDVELMLWLACVEVATAGVIGVPSVLWDVSAARVLVVLGTPEANALHCQWGVQAHYQRLWATTTANDDSRRGARERLPAGLAELLADPADRAASAVIEAIGGSATGPAA